MFGITQCQAFWVCSCVVCDSMSVWGRVWMILPPPHTPVWGWWPGGGRRGPRGTGPAGGQGWRCRTGQWTSGVAGWRGIYSVHIQSTLSLSSIRLTHWVRMCSRSSVAIPHDGSWQTPSVSCVQWFLMSSISQYGISQITFWLGLCFSQLHMARIQLRWRLCDSVPGSRMMAGSMTGIGGWRIPVSGVSPSNLSFFIWPTSSCCPSIGLTWGRWGQRGESTKYRSPAGWWTMTWWWCWRRGWRWCAWPGCCPLPGRSWPAGRTGPGAAGPRLAGSPPIGTQHSQVFCHRVSSISEVWFCSVCSRLVFQFY